MKAYEAAHEEIDEHVLDGASSAFINRVDAMLQKLEKDIDDVDAMRRVLDRDYDGKVTCEEFAPATASTTGVHLEKTPTGPTLSSSSVPSGMVLTQENKPNVQPTVPCYKLSSVSNSDMSLVGDYHNKYKYGPEDHNAYKVEERPAGISLEDDWRRRIEERLLAQEASIRDLSNCVGSLEETVKKHMTELSAAISVLIVKNKPSSDVFQDGESSSRVVDDDEEEEKDSPPPVTQAAESTNHFSTPESETAPPDTNTTVDAQTSSGIQYTPGVLHDDEDEDHFSSVFEQAAAVLDDDEDEDHLPPVFEQAMSEKRPTGVSESDVEEEEQQDEEEEAEEEEEEEEDSPVIQVSMDNPKGKVRDKAWEHVTQRTEETGKKVLICNFCRTKIRGGGINRVKKHLAGREGEVAPCKRVDSDVRVSIEASLKEIDRKRKDKASGSSNVVVSDDDEEEKEANKVQKGLTKNELREIIAEEVTRAIQATMPTILEQNMEKTCKMLEERFGVEKEKKQVNEDVVVVGENNEIKRRRGRSGKM